MERSGIVYYKSKSIIQPLEKSYICHKFWSNSISQALKLTATCDSYWVSKILIQAHAFAINLVHFLALKLTATRVSYLVSAPKLAATCFGKFLAPKSTATCNGYYYSILISVTLCPKTCNTLTQDTSGTLHWFYGEFLWGSKMKRMPCQLPNLLKSYPMIS